MGSKLFGKHPVKSGPTNRAPDSWWAPRFELDAREEFDAVSLVGSPAIRERKPLGAQNMQKGSKYE